MGKQDDESAVDVAMRAEGYVSATKVADAMGVHLTTIHHGIERGSIPGKRVAGTGKNGRWYVRIRELLERYPKDIPSIRIRLAALARTVPKEV